MSVPQMTRLYHSSDTESRPYYCAGRVSRVKTNEYDGGRRRGKVVKAVAKTRNNSGDNKRADDPQVERFDNERSESR